MKMFQNPEMTSSPITIIYTWQELSVAKSLLIPLAFSPYLGWPSRCWGPSTHPHCPSLLFQKFPTQPFPVQCEEWLGDGDTVPLLRHQDPAWHRPGNMPAPPHGYVNLLRSKVTNTQFWGKIGQVKEDSLCLCKFPMEDKLQLVLTPAALFFKCT